MMGIAALHPSYALSRIIRHSRAPATSASAIRRMNKPSMTTSIMAGFLHGGDFNKFKIIFFQTLLPEEAIRRSGISPPPLPVPLLTNIADAHRRKNKLGHTRQVLT